MMEIFLATVGNGKLAYHVFGAGKIDLVIEMGLGAVMGEWWQLAQRLGGEHTVLLYERAGYGSSTPSPADRRPMRPSCGNMRRPTMNGFLASWCRRRASLLSRLS